jgi:catechol 2,3-dioxygenase-like lactoylglutathione lyase family enzyme
MQRFGHLDLFVREPQASKSFYRDVLGFGITVEQEPSRVWIETEGFDILLRMGFGFNRSTPETCNGR